MKRILILVAAILFVTGCTQVEEVQITEKINADTPRPTETAIPTSTTIELPEEERMFSISGSTAMEKVGIATLDEFMGLNPQYEGEYWGVGNELGIKNVIDGEYNIGAVSRELKDDEKEYGLNQTLVGYNSVSVFVHPYVTVNTLTMEQLRGIYTGEISNWSEVGGPDEPITVFNREDGSSTRGLFLDVLGCEEIDFNSLENDSSLDFRVAEGSGGAPASIAWNLYSIGYTSRKYTDGGVKTIAVNGYLPTTGNIFSKDYPIASPCYYVYYEESLNQAARDYIDYIESYDAKIKIAEKGLTPNYSAEDINDSQIEETEMSLSNKVFTISGRNGVSWVSRAIIDGYNEKDLQYRGHLVFGESSTGILNAHSGKTQLGATYRELTEQEEEYGLSQMRIGCYPMAVVVNAKNKVDNLAFDELKGIFTGEITNWKQVGGDNKPIKLVYYDYEIERKMFYNLLGFEDEIDDDYIRNNFSAEAIIELNDIVSIIESNEYCICYLRFSELSDDFKTLSINGYAPDDNNILDGSYPIYQPCYYVYHEENLNEAAKDYLEFVVSEEGEKIIIENGLVFDGKALDGD